MAGPRPALQPRLLTAEEAAQYLGNITVRNLKRLRLGVVLLGSITRYDRRALDAYLDQLSGLGAKMASSAGPAPDQANDDSPEAAFERSAPNF